MAESGWINVEANSSSTNRFFCHRCNAEISPQLPDFLCPQCQSGFIEILADTSRQDNDSDSSTDMDTEFLELIADSNNSARTAGGGSSQSSENPSASRRSQRFRHIVHPRYARRRVGHDRQQSLVPLLQDLVMQVTSGVIEASVGGNDLGMFPTGAFEIPMLVTSNLASNPGDYVWGRGGLDAIITQLMNQLDGTGPPPLPQEKINQIPSVKISQEQCDKSLQCTVCMEDYKLNESVRKLNCEHCYHDDCIIPWLQLHGTCPVCRKTLSGSDFSNHQNDMQMFFTQPDQLSSESGEIFEGETTPETITVEDNPSDDPYSRLNLMEDELD